MKNSILITPDVNEIIVTESMLLGLQEKSSYDEFFGNNFVPNYLTEENPLNEHQNSNIENQIDDHSPLNNFPLESIESQVSQAHSSNETTQQIKIDYSIENTMEILENINSFNLENDQSFSENNSPKSNYSFEESNFAMLSSSLPAQKSSNPRSKKKYSPSIQKKIEEIEKTGQEAAVFGNRVVIKYSEVYFYLRKRNDLAVTESRKKNELERKSKEQEFLRLSNENNQLRNDLINLTIELEKLKNYSA